MRIGIIGLGLIGGSLAKSLKKTNPAHSYIIGYDKEAAFSKAAFHEGSINYVANGIGNDFSNCHIIFICTTVDLIPRIMSDLLPFVPNGCIITDIGSTKAQIMTSITKVLETTKKNIYFIGGHPMTGSEKSGYFAASSHLFENAYYLLTPQPDTPPYIVFILEKIIERIGGLPLVLSPNYHDFATATVSHLPHIIASSLVHLVKNNDDSNHYLHALAAGGFKDITRVASSSPYLWQSVCQSNALQIKEIFKTYLDILNNFYIALETNNEAYLYDFFDTAKSYRDTFPNGMSGAFIKIYTLYVDIKDEPGIIASIATLLSKHSINIKDIGIMKHREFNTGVLKVCFENKAYMVAATNLLIQEGYSINY